MWFALLGCTPPIDTGAADTGAPVETGTAERTWVEINTAPCARDSDGYVGCWSSQSWAGIVPGGATLRVVEPGPVPVRELSDIMDGMWGVRSDDLMPLGFLLCGDPDCWPPSMEGFEDLNPQCARRGTEIICWSSNSSAFPPELSYTKVNGSRWFHAALTTDNQLLMRIQDPDDPQGTDIQLDPTKTYVDVAAIDFSSACVLAENGDVECYGPEGIGFDNPPYVMIASGYYSMCAVRADWVIECRDGSTYDFGPLRDIAVESEVSFTLVDEGTPDERWFSVYPDGDTPPDICVITQDNAVRCDGWKYQFKDLQEALPSGG